MVSYIPFFLKPNQIRPGLLFRRAGASQECLVEMGLVSEQGLKFSQSEKLGMAEIQVIEFLCYSCESIWPFIEKSVFNKIYLNLLKFALNTTFA